MNRKEQISRSREGTATKIIRDAEKSQLTELKPKRVIPMLRSGKPDFNAMKARKRPLSEQYQAHIGSEHWRIIRLLCFERDGFRCVVCFAATDLDCHHRSYAHFGNERLADLTTLCRRCHEIFTEHGVLVKEGSDVPGVR